MEFLRALLAPHRIYHASERVQRFSWSCGSWGGFGLDLWSKRNYHVNKILGEEIPCTARPSSSWSLAASLVITSQPVKTAGQAATPSVNQNQAAKPPDFRLEDGTPIKLRLSRTISSADAQANDKVDFEVLEEVKVDGIAVIPKGSVAWGTVTEAQSKRRMARGGKLDVNIDDVRLVDGEKAALRAVREVKGGGHTGGMTAGIVATSLIVWPAAPFFLFMHGKDVTIPKGTEVTAYINGDMNLDPAKFASKPATEAGVLPTSSTATAESTTLAVRSTPEGADITVDGKYKGSTPSSLRVEAGDRSVSVEKPGFKKWQRTVSIDAGSNIRLDMTLEPDQSANVVQVPSNPPIAVKQLHDATPVPAQSTNIVQVPSNPPISAKQPHDATPVPAQSTNIVQVPFNPPVSATQPHEAAQIVPPGSDIQKRQPTGPATGESAIKPIKSGAGTAQVSGEQGMTGSFEGEVRNETLGVTAGYEITVREENGGIYGCSTVQTPLSGSGGLNGSVNGSRVVFETEGKKFHVRFIGELQSDEMKGTYTVLSTSEHGGFVLKRTNYNAPPFGFDTKKCRKD